MQHDLVTGLKQVPIFSNLDQEELDSLAAHAVVKTFPKNAIIINEGDETASFYIVLSGRVRVFLSNEMGKEVTLEIEERGRYFGELALLDNAPRSASVITMEKCSCGIISKAEFNRWLGKYPSAANTIIRSLVKKIRSLTENVKTFALSDVYGRLIKVLQDMAKEQEGKQVISEKPTQQELANMIGASREMVSKIFKELITGGYLIVDGKTLTIAKKLPASW